MIFLPKHASRKRGAVTALTLTAVAAATALATTPASAASSPNAGDLPPAAASAHHDRPAGQEQARLNGPDYWVEGNSVRLRARPIDGPVLNVLHQGNGLDPLCWWNWDGDPWLRAHAWGGATGYVHWRLVHIGAARPGRC
ncbi:hypothetical protein [Amycolatopsis sp. CA-230715]|uniref:hypothetical protein n=1 Tax=Amycolatopsis sp. CA-230715 TaxID=2745196 RepID=UPI001C01057D|nr:hypothetical protein [Amycolatopsis sp. CA-230715]QWF81003.1 hypothetical protein HUW46_04428 [Amycolatopsis sp. CA-230715]